MAPWAAPPLRFPQRLFRRSAKGATAASCCARRSSPRWQGPGTNPRWWWRWGRGPAWVGVRSSLSLHRRNWANAGSGKGTPQPLHDKALPHPPGRPRKEGSLRAGRQAGGMDMSKAGQGRGGQGCSAETTRSQAPELQPTSAMQVLAAYRCRRERRSIRTRLGPGTAPSALQQRRHVGRASRSACRPGASPMLSLPSSTRPPLLLPTARPPNPCHVVKVAGVVPHGRGAGQVVQKERVLVPAVGPRHALQGWGFEAGGQHGCGVAQES